MNTNSSFNMSGIKRKRASNPFGQWILLVFILNILTFHLSAQQSISDSLVSERLHAIEQMLNSGKPNANAWWYGWLIGYSAATIGQGVIMISSNSQDTRQDMALGGFTTILGAAGQLIAPMDPALAPEKLAQFLESTREERFLKLTEAESLLRQSAERERSGRSWQEHAICGVVNVSSGLITWFGFHRNALAGFENFALNTVITEAQIFTQPTRAMKDYNSYLKKYSSLQASLSKNSEVRLLLYAIPGGVSARLIF
jgi:hypothetical protein